MKTARIDIGKKRSEALVLFSKGGASPDKLELFKASMHEALAACDKTTEAGRMDHGALLLFLCAIEDLEKRETTKDSQLRARLSMAADVKFRSAEIQYDRA